MAESIPPERPSSTPPPGRGRGWPWVLGVSIAGLLAVLAYLFTEGGDSGWGEPGDELSADEPEPRMYDGESTIGAQGAQPPPLPGEPSPAPVAEVDPRELAALLFDGGWGPPEAGLAQLNEDPYVAEVEEPAAEPAEEPEPRAPTPPERIAPTAPQTAHRRAVFWRDMLSERITTLRRQAEEAAEQGDDALAARLRRMVGRLEAQRPALDRRVGELEHAAANAPPLEE